jgi:hypothetical protein
MMTVYNFVVGADFQSAFFIDEADYKSAPREEECSRGEGASS